MRPRTVMNMKVHDTKEGTRWPFGLRSSAEDGDECMSNSAGCGKVAGCRSRSCPAICVERRSTSETAIKGCRNLPDTTPTLGYLTRWPVRRCCTAVFTRKSSLRCRRLASQNTMADQRTGMVPSHSGYNVFPNTVRAPVMHPTKPR